MIVSYELKYTAEELGIVGVIENPLGSYIVLDKEPGESEQVLLIPFLWDHRRVVDKDGL